MIRLFFLIRALEQGGAERQLIELARHLDQRRFAVTVATFYAGGALHAELAGVAGVRLIALGKRGRWDVLPFLWRLWRLLRAERPAIVHGYMEGGNLLGLLLGPLVGARVVWGLRASNMNLDDYDWAPRLTFWLGARCSRLADAIILNSEAGRRHHLAHGYSGAHMLVIPNGIDVERFRPDAAARARVRQAWHVAPDVPLIGLVGRLDPMKDHPTFLRAAALVAAQNPRARFVCVGDGPPAYRAQLAQLADTLGLGPRLIWAGARGDMPAVYNGLDLLASSSACGEGFANVLGEAMACALPVVATDVGDAAVIIGDPARVVAPGDPAALAGRLLGLLALAPAGRQALGAAGRDRIVANYSIDRLADTTQAVLEGMT